MYKIPNYIKSKLSSIEKVDGETLELKIERIVANKEPIKDGAPEIYTEKSQGVLAGYNIRTDRWELAADAMDYIQRSKQAKRDELAKKTDVEKDAIIESGIGQPESAQGKERGK